MKAIASAALLATTLLTPAAVWAQAAPPNNACDQLIQAINNDASAASSAGITLQQAQDYQSKGNNTACNTALLKVNPQAANATNTGQAASGNVQVAQGAPQVTVTQQPATVTVNPGQPQITIHQPAPVVTVQIPAPDVTLILPNPNVSVAQPQPQVAVTQAKPQVTVVPPAQQAQAVTSGQQNPQVTYNADKAQVTVNQADKPTIHVEQQSASAATNQNQQTAQTQSGAQQGQLQPKEIAVKDLVGKSVMGSQDNQSLGMITAVIMDSKNMHFVILDQNGKQFALDANEMVMKGNSLMVNGTAANNKLAPWTDAQARANGIQQLTGTQTIMVQQATG